MCGVISGYSNKSLFLKGLKSLHHRGPDNTGFVSIGDLFIGHTRLSIIDTSSRSNQPFILKNITLSYNGELWNYKTLREMLKDKHGIVFKTKGDTEVVTHMLSLYGTQALKKLDGMFGLVWHDGNTLRAARDVFGEIPLYYSPNHKWCASENKALKSANIHDGVLLPPGCFIELDRKKTSTPFIFDSIQLQKHSPATINHTSNIRMLLDDSCRKKLISDVPVCCLISGGIDSALILSMIKKYNPDIKAYTAVFNRKSSDYRRAVRIAEHLNVELVEVEIPKPTKDGLSKVIDIIEMPHKAQVEIGLACFHLAKQIHKDGFKVVFSGEGSDELFGSYGFSYHAIASGVDWSVYRKELFETQHRKNFLRCNNIFMSFGIECRLPFLHKPLVEYILSLPLDITKRDKAPLKSVIHEMLPPDLISKTKIAFQDGLGLKNYISELYGGLKPFYTSEYQSKYNTKPTLAKLEL